MNPSSTPERTAALKDDPRLKPYFSNEEERREVTKAMFDEAASGYDHAEALTALGSGAWYRREVLERCGLSPGMSLLDVAAGTVELVGYTEVSCSVSTGIFREYTGRKP